MLKTFSLGGVHPADNKLSANSPVQGLPIPGMASVQVSQHIGAAGEVLVTKGEQVKVGQLLVKSSGFISANIHSPVSGVVDKIDDAIDPSGFKRKTIIIKTVGDEWLETIDRSPLLVSEITLSPGEIIQKIGEAGIVGLGGATFPAHVKLSPPPGKKCDLLIINGAECEPYLTGDHRLMLEKGEVLLVGTKILMKALGAQKAIIGIENNKMDAVEHLRKLARNLEGITVQPLKARYPQGGEKQLIDACAGRKVPAGKLPVEVGVVVHNVATAIAVYEAVQKANH